MSRVRVSAVLILILACGLSHQPSEVDELLQRAQYADAWSIAQSFPDSTNVGVYCRLKVITASGCEATTDMRAVDVQALEARFNLKQSNGWSLLRERLIKGDALDKYVAWRLLSHVISEQQVRASIADDREMRQALLTYLSGIDNCPPTATIKCPQSYADFDVNDEFAGILAAATIVAVYRDPETYAALASLSKCPSIFPWLLESGAFSPLDAGAQRALVSRLIERQQIEKEVDVILDVLAVNGNREGAALLGDAKIDEDLTNVKRRNTIAAILRRERDASLK